MKKRLIIAFALIFVTGAGLQVKAQAPVTPRSAKDYIKDKEKTDPNMYRHPDDRKIRLDSNIQKIDTWSSKANAPAEKVKKTSVKKKTLKGKKTRKNTPQQVKARKTKK